MPSLAGMSLWRVAKLGQIAVIITYTTSPPLRVWIANQNIANITLEMIATVGAVDQLLSVTDVTLLKHATYHSSPRIPTQLLLARERVHDIARR